MQIGKTTYPGSEMLAHRFPELELHESSLFSSDATSPGSASSVVDSGLGSSLAASPSSTNAMTSPIQSVYEEPPCSEVFATFLGNIFASGTSPGSNQRMLSNEPSPPEHRSQESQDGFPYFVTNIDLQPFLASTIAEPWNDYPMYTNVYPSASISGPPAVDRQEEIAMTRPSEPELQYYCKPRMHDRVIWNTNGTMRSISILLRISRSNAPRSLTYVEYGRQTAHFNQCHAGLRSVVCQNPCCNSIHQRHSCVCERHAHWRICELILLLSHVAILR